MVFSFLMIIIIKGYLNTVVSFLKNITIALIPYKYDFVGVPCIAISSFELYFLGLSMGLLRYKALWEIEWI